MAFLKKVCPLPNLLLCGKHLPWTDKCKHLGLAIANRIDGCQDDMRVKNAMHVVKNNDLNQEFYFAHPDTKLAPSLSALQDRHVNQMLQHTTQDSLQIQIQQSVKPKPWLF